MAIFHCSTKLISRSAGRSAVAAAAYRSATQLTDQRTGLSHDYTKKQGVIQAYTLLPSGQQVAREALWNAAEIAENRKDARTAREWIVALPEELVPRTDQTRKLITGSPDFELVEQFAKALSQRYQVAVDVAIHAPDQEGDQRNYHAHILTTTRQVQEQEGTWALTTKSPIELSDTDRRKQGLGSGADEVKAVRQLWETLANTKLEQERKIERIDHRSFKDQGIDQAPSVHLGYKATEMERKKLYSERGDLNRLIAHQNHRRRQVKAELIDLNQEREKRATPSLSLPNSPPPFDETKVLKDYEQAWHKEVNQLVINYQKGADAWRESVQRYQQDLDQHQTTVPKKGYFEQKSTYQAKQEHWEEVQQTLKQRLDKAHADLEQANQYTNPNTASHLGSTSALATLAHERTRLNHPFLAHAYDKALQLQAERQAIEEQAKKQKELETKQQKQAQQKILADLIRSQDLKAINQHTELQEVQQKIERGVRFGRDRQEMAAHYARMIEEKIIHLGKPKSQSIEY